MEAWPYTKLIKNTLLLFKTKCHSSHFEGGIDTWRWHRYLDVGAENHCRMIHRLGIA